MIFPLSQEINTIGRILKACDGKPFLPIQLPQGNPGDAALTELCQKLSLENKCKAFICRDAETYGNANVYNGGSDFEVVEEDCFLVVCDCGRIELSEHTDHWNELASELMK